MREPYRLAPDCPQCGAKDSIDDWGGARMWSSGWGHKYSCCSDECGHAFLSNPKRKAWEKQEVRDQMRMLKQQLKEME